ncbi:type 1 glutamine amidotransferase [Spirochaeta africana]|uniref:GMP synthase family protein n=1 Tax=Spirochaeta africana (strain ATCC 700263 / DSM 8902 / Z-7692) TaxID=889378 RepID=H9ULD9_SPIAZ|nr:gamma-glutamyl-gamma-aminobutyrate hydrolase family protein [Spirochaeta africana]AFG38332.1 GMP synthase family protein [Spirochaeta africana DSM 8902]
MRIHCLQHVPYESPGAIRDWAAARGHSLGNSLLFQPDWNPHSLPSPGETDLLVIMGGPMSVHDQADYPWLTAEKRYILASLDAGIPMLGICLGAQLIAEALGARVYPAPEKEIGWFPVQGLPADQPGQIALPQHFVPLHWHGETFDLPPGTRRLASSPVCANQGFSLDDRVIGLQFHLEMQPQLLAGLIEHSQGELVTGPWIQSAEEMRTAAPAACQATQPVLEQVLDRLHRSAQ